MQFELTRNSYLIFSQILWQGKFVSFGMEEFHLLACTRYIELNPARAGLVKRPEE